MLDEETIGIRRARLSALIRIGSKTHSETNLPQSLMKEALEFEPKSVNEKTMREEKLRELFTKYVPGGWIEEGSEDQDFLLNAPKQTESFWFGW
ncbi:MAG: hypothetical protein ACW97Z_09135 [Candidatus Hodarchaeales archaeon]|jgi:hypothetical protein